MATIEREHKRGMQIDTNKHSKSITIRPTTPHSAGNFSGSGTRTHYFSTKTGSRVSSSGAKLKGHSNLPGKLVGATPEGRALKVGSSLKSHLRPPRSDKRTIPAIKKATNHSPVLLAEYLLALAVVSGKGISDISQNGYKTAISGIMLRFTAITAIWFVLFLLASGKRGSIFASWFGGLVVLGIVFDAANSGVLTNMTQVIKGQGITPVSTGSGAGNNSRSINNTELAITTEKPQEFYQTASGEQQPAGQLT